MILNKNKILKEITICKKYKEFIYLYKSKIINGENIIIEIEDWFNDGNRFTTSEIDTKKVEYIKSEIRANLEEIIDNERHYITKS